jgi:hypothetical protein
MNTATAATDILHLGVNKCLVSYETLYTGMVGRMTANVSVLYDVADFQHESPIRSTTV